MTEQYKEFYQNKYREETSQVHAPADLIERTKAAVRAEEERILIARTAQPGMRQPEMTEPRVTYADYAKYGKTSSLRKWTYPLTAVAALLILVSVSLTMRGLKSGNMAAPAADTAYSGAAYEESAELDTEFAESVAETTVEMVEEEAPAAAAEAPMAEENGVAMEQTVGAAETESAVAEASAADMAPALNDVQKSMNTMDDEALHSPSGTEESEAKREATMSKQDTVAEDSLSDMAAGKNGITMEKVEKKPTFCDLPDVKTYVYEEDFFVRKEKAGWVAYTETENGEGYIFRGEMEDVEEFLEAIRQSLAEL